PPETWEEVMRINLNGTFYVTQAVVRKMIPKRSGTILSITSSVGRKGRADWGAYAVSKFGLEGMMQTLAEEVADYGIRVITLNPEATRTKMRALAYPKEDLNTLKDPVEVAKGLLYLAKSTDASLHGKSLNMSELKINAES
ncbi:SDR family NAD(P)-dependent oxidoreductase, partial [Nitrospira defluvii]|nr:SDR family NAD(P)-dependent oxidoreductase [Nitrospira defluvii]